MRLQFCVSGAALTVGVYHSEFPAALLLVAAEYFFAVAPAIAGRYVNEDKPRTVLSSTYQGLFNVDTALVRLAKLAMVRPWQLAT